MASYSEYLKKIQDHDTYMFNDIIEEILGDEIVGSISEVTIDDEEIEVETVEYYGCNGRDYHTRTIPIMDVISFIRKRKIQELTNADDE